MCQERGQGVSVSVPRGYFLIIEHSHFIELSNFLRGWERRFWTIDRISLRPGGRVHMSFIITLFFNLWLMRRVHSCSSLSKGLPSIPKILLLIQLTLYSWLRRRVHSVKKIPLLIFVINFNDFYFSSLSTKETFTSKELNHSLIKNNNGE